MSGLSRAPAANAAPAPKRAPWRAGMPASRSVARDFAGHTRILRNSLVCRMNNRKYSSVVITLAALLTISGPTGFRLLTRSR